jgi:hypothetical protein
MNGRHRFPSEQLNPTQAGFGATLEFNPYAKLPPSLWYAFHVDLAPIELGENAYAPDVFGTVIKTTLVMGGIELPFRRWTEIEGAFGPFKDVGEGSLYVSDAHNTVLVQSLEMSRKVDCTWNVSASIAIDFESGYERVETTVEFAAAYTGISFVVPEWTKTPRFPKSWRIPSEFTQDTVDEMVARFVDLDIYDRRRRGTSFRYIPKKRTGA